MLVSTTVVSTRRRRPRTTRRSRPRATSRATTSLSTGSSNTWANRISVLASGTRSPSMRQKARYTKLPRTSRSHSSKVQSWRCLRTSIRRTTAAGVPNRPRRRLCGWRWAKASVTRSTRTSSSRTTSICRSVESQSLSASGRSTSTRLRCRYARRTMAPPVRPPGLRGAPRELRSRATCEIALLPHHHASRVPPSTNNCSFGQDFREAARTNTGCPRPNSHRKVFSRRPRQIGYGSSAGFAGATDRHTRRREKVLQLGHVEHRRIEPERALADGLEHSIDGRRHQRAGSEITERALGRVVFVRAPPTDDLDDLRGDVQADLGRHVLRSIGERSTLEHVGGIPAL